MIYRVVIFLACATLLGAQTKASPATLTFSYQEGDAKLPVSQTLAISGAAGGSATVVASGGPWLTASPTGGTLPLSLKILANPTSLPVGTYTGTITVTASAQSVAVPVTLTVKAAPSSLTASSSAVAVNYVRGTSVPAPSSVNLTSSGAEALTPSRVLADTTTCPPWPTAVMREVVLTSMPM